MSTDRTEYTVSVSVTYNGDDFRSRNAALRRERDAFQERWGKYVKCSKCGGRVAAGGYAWDAAPSPCCQALVLQNGYAPPPQGTV